MMFFFKNHSITFCENLEIVSKATDDVGKGLQYVRTRT